MRASQSIKATAVCLLLVASSMGSGVGAAEDFRVRYNLAGTLGGEIFAPLPSPGWVGAFSLTDVDAQKIIGPDGRDLSRSLPGGTVPLA